VIKHVGNYGEAFERNFGQRSPFKMERGVNGLVAKGGRQQAPTLKQQRVELFNFVDDYGRPRSSGDDAWEVSRSAVHMAER
jgi:hypothetical protein